MVTDQQPATQDPVEPFIRWAGGKRFLAHDIARMLPAQYGHYYEPFLGGGALFFALGGPPAVLSDSNSDLIECYEEVQSDVENVIDVLSSMGNSEHDYYRVRGQSPRTSLERAARLIYLVNLSFNGIYRVNFENHFNVPYGRRPHRPPCEPHKLRRASTCLQRASLLVCDFADAVIDARPADVIYFDPPYTVAHSQNGFVRYNRRLFSWPDQQRLALTARALSERGCNVIVTNADHGSIRDLYPGFHRRTVERSSTMAADVAWRQHISELIIYKQTAGR